MSIDAENVSGQGGGPNLLVRNMRSPAYGDYPAYATVAKPARSTSDYAGMGGILFTSCYDLSTMGTFGSAIQTAKGYRYLWIISPDHDSYYNFGGLDSICIYRGFSNDPLVFPSPDTMLPVISGRGAIAPSPAASFNGWVDPDGITLHVTGITSPGVIALGYIINGGLTGSPAIATMVSGRGYNGTYTLSVNQGGAVGSSGSPIAMTATFPGNGLYVAIYFGQFVYNADTNLGHLYIQGIASSGATTNNQTFNGLVFTTSDADTWTCKGVAFTNWQIPNFATTAQQQPMRLGVNNWISFGVNGDADPGAPGYWTSTDGFQWVFQGNVNQKVGGSTYGNRILGAPKFTVAGQDYALVGEDARGSGWNPATTYSIGDRANVITSNVAEFTASVDPDGVTLRVTAMSFGQIAVGLGVPQLPAVAFNTRCLIAAFGGGSGPPGTGGVGTYTISVNQGGAVTSRTMDVRVVDQNWYAFLTYQSLTNSNINNPPVKSPTNWVATTDGFQYVAKVAIDSNGNVLSSPAPVRISNAYVGQYPGPTYMGVQAGINESGFALVYALHGFYPAISPPNNVVADVYEKSGPLSQEYYDVYYYIYDATAAANAAPLGVQASCAGGNVLIRWYDIIPGRSAYRVSRATSLGGTYTTLSSTVTVGQYLDTTATPGSVYYYKVITLDAGGTAQGSRIVSTYVGLYDSLTCAHVTRALAGGADQTTISEWRIAKLVRWLNANNRLKNLKIATFAWMGVVQDGSHVISRIFDLGTTYMPRMGDLTPTTTKTTYSATAINSVTPGWVNADSSSFGCYGLLGRSTSANFCRFNPIRMWPACTIVASYQRSGTGQTSYLGYYESSATGVGIVPGMVLRTTSGSPGTAQFSMTDFVNNIATSTVNLTGSGAHILMGTYDGNGTVTCYADGVAGTPVGGLLDNMVLYGEDSSTSGTPQILSVGSGIGKLGITGENLTASYTFENNESAYSGHGILAFDDVLNAEERSTLNQILQDDVTAITVKDIKVNYSAKGDGQLSTQAFTTSGVGNTTLAAATSTFVSGDTGKYFVLSGAGAQATFTGFVDADGVTLHASGVSGTINYYDEIGGSGITGNPVSLTPGSGGAGIYTLSVNQGGAVASTTMTATTALGGTMIFVDSTHVTISPGATTALSGSTHVLEWGMDDGPAFHSFHTALTGTTTPVELDVPAGRYCFMTVGVNGPFFGISNLRVVGSGAVTFTDLRGTGTGVFLGGCLTGQFQDTAHSARTTDCSVGALSITLKNVSDAALFTPPCWALMTGYDVQGFGSPTNHYVYEYVYIISKSGATLNIRAPLNNLYKSTWPLFSFGSNDWGGPATLYALEAGWDCDHEYVGIGISSPGQTNSIGRNITFTAYTGSIIYPTRQKQWTCNAVTMSLQSAEMDKLNTLVTINGGHWHGLPCQSPSPITLVLENVVVDKGLLGTGQNNSFIGCTFNGESAFGSYAYGCSTSVYTEACSYAGLGGTSFSPGGVKEGDIFGAGAYQFLAGGIIKRAKSAGTGAPPQWANPGGLCFIGGQYETEFPFQIKDIYEDGTNIFIQTTLAGFPNLPASATYSIRTHPCPQLTVVSCSGCVDAVDMSGAPTAAAPMYSYTKRMFSNWTAQQQSTSLIWGKLVSYNISVDTAYTGTHGTLNLEVPGQFGCNTITPAAMVLFYDPVVNTKQTGQRTILPGSVAAQSGDALGAAPGAIWFANAVDPFLDTSISGEATTTWPSITIELVTDQSFTDQSFSVAPVLAANAKVRYGGWYYR